MPGLKQLVVQDPVPAEREPRRQQSSSSTNTVLTTVRKEEQRPNVEQEILGNIDEEVC